MINVFRITYQEHLVRKTEKPEDKVDNWRSVTRDVAVEDGDAKAAIDKLLGLPPHDNTAPELVAERKITAVQPVSTAE